MIQHRTLYYLFNASIVSLSVCYITALFESSTVSSSVSYVTIVSLSVCYVTILSISSRFPLFHYLFATLLLHSRFCRSLPLHFLLRLQTISSWFKLFYYLFIKSVLCSRLRLFLPLYVTHYYLFRLSLRHYTIFSRFPLFFICLLRHCSVLGFIIFMFITSL